MGEFIYQRMERDPVFRADIHRAKGCCHDGNCDQKKVQVVAVSADDFEES